MSADNFYLIRKHPNGGFAAIMGFASDETELIATKKHKQFDSLQLAHLYAYSEYSEYGVHIHPECFVDMNDEQ